MWNAGGVRPRDAVMLLPSPPACHALAASPSPESPAIPLLEKLEVLVSTTVYCAAKLLLMLYSTWNLGISSRWHQHRLRGQCMHCEWARVDSVPPAERRTGGGLVSTAIPLVFPLPGHIFWQEAAACITLHAGVARAAGCACHSAGQCKRPCIACMQCKPGKVFAYFSEACSGARKPSGSRVRKFTPARDWRTKVGKLPVRSLLTPERTGKIVLEQQRLQGLPGMDMPARRQVSRTGPPAAFSGPRPNVRVRCMLPLHGHAGR